MISPGLWSRCWTGPSHTHVAVTGCHMHGHCETANSRLKTPPRIAEGRVETDPSAMLARRPNCELHLA